MFDYLNILKTARLRPSKMTGRNILTESESDRGRVLFSPAFRRLQQKAQVFSMEPNAAVRSRLTHSFEVSQIGRYIADLLSEKLGIATEQQAGALVNFVETACLMHDIGNPPFGHFGEEAIKKWFEDNGERCLRLSIGRPKPSDGACPDQAKVRDALVDFADFDGNPQGLRIVARLQWNTDEFGLNLTKTSLASFMKYIRMAGGEKSGIFTKKAGYFTTERDLVESVWREFGYELPQRFPLAYIMEAADDIAYCISDLEDSFEKDIVRPDDALSYVEEQYERHEFEDGDPKHVDIRRAIRQMRAKERESGGEFTFTDFRTSLNNVIVNYVADRYVENHSKILDGTLESLIPGNEPPGAILNAIRKFCREHVYTHESVQRVELAGYNAIRGLLEQCSSLLCISAEGFRAARANEKQDAKGQALVLEPKLLRLFPEKYIKVYDYHLKQAGGDEADPFLEWTYRAHLIVDFISGMTDDFAMTTYRTLAGMRL
ncbi:dGTPase [Cupriavidus necator]|nr:dGTPase [Cupriavidus necator]